MLMSYPYGDLNGRIKILPFRCFENFFAYNKLFLELLCYRLQPFLVGITSFVRSLEINFYEGSFQQNTFFLIFVSHLPKMPHSLCIQIYYCKEGHLPTPSPCENQHKWSKLVILNSYEIEVYKFWHLKLRTMLIYLYAQQLLKPSKILLFSVNCRASLCGRFRTRRVLSLGSCMFRGTLQFKSSKDFFVRNFINIGSAMVLRQLVLQVFRNVICVFKSCWCDWSFQSSKNDDFKFFRPCFYFFKCFLKFLQLNFLGFQVCLDLHIVK